MKHHRQSAQLVLQEQQQKLHAAGVHSQHDLLIENQVQDDQKVRVQG
jgi:hypothetical protein